MSIAERIGLLIHWFSFLVGVNFFIIVFAIGFFEAKDAWQIFLTAFSAPFLLFISCSIGWLIRYILAGKVHLLPWKNN